MTARVEIGGWEARGRLGRGGRGRGCGNGEPGTGLRDRGAVGQKGMATVLGSQAQCLGGQ